MADGEAAQPRAREIGYDVARAIAIVGMVLINFPIFLASLDGEAGRPLAWLAHVHFGRAAALFVTLAGVGVALMSRGVNPWAVRRTLALRALFLFVLGNLLLLVWPIDILHFYAFYLAIAALMLITLPRWALLVGVALIAAATLAINIAWPDIESTLDVSTDWPPSGEGTYWSALGMAQNVFISGVHPVLPWIAFLMTGLWVGRHDLTDAATRGRFMALGAALGIGAPLVSAVLERIVASGALPGETLLYLGVLHAPSPLYVLAACGTSMFVIALCQAIAARWRPARVVRALAHAGQMALTLYLAHALLGVVIPQEAFGIDGLPLAWVLAYALAFSAAAIVLAHLYRLKFARGPIELVMRLVAGAPRARGDVSPVRLAAAWPRWPYAAAAAAAVLLALQVVGFPPNVGCARGAIDGARTTGALSLLCPRQSFALNVTERADVTLETLTNRDLVLELYRGEERIAINDDGGVGVNARIVATLEPGAYLLVARPYQAALGAFMLTRRDAEPTVRSLAPGQMCTDNCASARDGECDDGGPNALYAVCDLGADCADCGVRDAADMQSLLNEAGQLCFETCATANDRECDDGGPDSLYSLCTLGSDCADCGPRAPPLTPIPR